MIHQLLYYVFAYILILLQTSTIISAFSVFDLRPDFLLILVTLFSLEFRTTSSLIFAFVSGLLLDLFNPGWFGLNALGLIICSYVVSSISSRIYRERLLNRLIFVFLMYCIRDLIVFVITGKIDLTSILSRFFSNSIPCAIWTTVLALFLIPTVELLSGRMMRGRLQIPDEE